VNRSHRWLLPVTMVAGALLVWFLAAPPRSKAPAVEAVPADDLSQPATIPARSDRSRRGPARRESSVERGTADAPVAATEPVPPAPPPSPPSQGLRVDAAGNFYPEASTIDRFESSLATNQPVERSLAAIRADIARELGPPAEQQALEFLDRYMEYRNRGIELGLNQDVTEDFTPRFAQLRSLRREFFGIEVGQRLFGEQERAANIAIREAEILGDDSLSESEKARRLSELYNPPPDRNE
jgi:hypothetical protein